MWENSTEEVGTLCSNCNEPITWTSYETDDWLVCETCRDDGYWFCKDCNRYHNNNIETEYSINDWEFSSCQVNQYYKCMDCWNLYTERELCYNNSRREQFVCHHCEDNRRECYECWYIMSIDDAQRRDNQQERYCDNCAPDDDDEESPDNTSWEVEDTSKATIELSQDPVPLGDEAKDMLSTFYGRTNTSFYSDDSRFEYAPIKDFLLEGTIEICKWDINYIYNKYKLYSLDLAKDNIYIADTKLMWKVIVDDTWKTIWRLWKLLQKIIDGKKTYFRPETSSERITTIKTEVSGLLKELQWFQNDTYRFKLWNTLDLKLESMKASVDGKISTCQNRDNANDYAQWYYDFIFNGCNMVLLMYDKNDEVVFRELVRYFIHDWQSLSEEVLFFDRPYGNWSIANSKWTAILEVIKQLPKGRFKVALPTESSHDSSTHYYVFQNSEARLILDQSDGKNLRQPKRELRKRYCAYYRDSYTKTYHCTDDPRYVVYDYCNENKFEIYNIK